jgi:ATP-binding cassette subfamily B protein/ATP-binding cassette subfamily C protein
MWEGKLNYTYEYKHKEETSAANHKINYFYSTTHDFSYGKDIRIYHLKDRIMANYDAEIGTLKRILQKLRNKEYLRSFLSLGTLLLTNVLMYGILIDEAFHGMPISSFSMYISAITSLMASLLMLGNDISMMADQGQYVADYFRLIDSNLITGEGTARKPEKTLEIVFDNVTFHYPGSEKNVFENLSFTIHKGEKLAIVGVNGAGKSTLVKLMTGLYEPTGGQIFINGREIRQYSK